MEIDENGVLRLKGRIKAAKDVSFTLNRPAVLSGDSSIAKLIMKHYHERFNHGNHNTVMNEIRQKYYITSLRSKLRKIAQECQWCRIKKTTRNQMGGRGTTGGVLRRPTSKIVVLVSLRRDSCSVS
ncbi:hypothetical protein EVAR_66098_1 [Eumeta japonica]|uniref:Integrase zinc-binding domain-containing protein n=1 Tax=Eumeta variegata TaxID=151549 RepID=A0A4C1ZUZ2_EUMVA|nr:hypothetical protein EVAR_66098_1 [Eumeta japonica]